MPSRFLLFQELARRVPVPDHIYEFAADLVRRTRPKSSDAPDWLKPLVGWGAGPRAVQYLILGAKTRAALTGSYMVRLEDILEVAEPVLTHRVITTFAAESEGVSSRDVVKRLSKRTPSRRVARSGRTEKQGLPRLRSSQPFDGLALCMPVRPCLEVSLDDTAVPFVARV